MKKISAVLEANREHLPICSIFWNIEKINKKEESLKIIIDKYCTSEYPIIEFYKPISLFLNLSKYGR